MKSCREYRLLYLYNISILIYRVLWILCIAALIFCSIFSGLDKACMMLKTNDLDCRTNEY